METTEDFIAAGDIKWYQAGSPSVCLSACSGEDANGNFISGTSMKICREILNLVKIE
jgi:hypothetical protein